MADPFVEQGQPNCGGNTLQDSTTLPIRNNPSCGSVQHPTDCTRPSHAQPTWWYQQAPPPGSEGAVLQPVSPASSASLWTQSDLHSSVMSLEQCRSAQRAAELADSLPGDESANGDDPRDYIAEEELYRSLAENGLAMVPYGISLERYIAGVIYRYGRGEWSIEDARQVCAYVTGPHRLAPLLWRTARVAPRPPGQRGQQPSHLATSRFVMESAHDSYRYRRSTSRGLHDNSRSSQPSRDQDRYHHNSSRSGGERGSSDEPFALSSVQGSRHGQGRLGLQEGSALRTADRITQAVSPSASENGPVFWDESTAQQMCYIRHQEATEITTEPGSFGDHDTSRRYTASPESPGHGHSDAAHPSTHSGRERPETGRSRDQRSVSSLQGIFHSITLEEGCGFLVHGDSSAVHASAVHSRVGVEFPPHGRRSRDDFLAHSLSSHVDSRSHPSSIPSTTDGGLHVVGGFSDENDANFAHSPSLIDRRAYRAFTSRQDGVWVDPACPDGFNAAPYAPPHPNREPIGGAQRQSNIETLAHTQSAPAGDDRTRRQHSHSCECRVASRRTGSGEEGPRDHAAEDEDGCCRPYRNSQRMGSGHRNGRICDIFQGQHGEGMVCGLTRACHPLRRSHSAPGLQPDPNLVPPSDGVSRRRWLESEQSQRTDHPQTDADDDLHPSSQEPHLCRRPSPVAMADGADHLTQYYSTILDKMKDPASNALMYRTLDIFNNQPPSTASTVKTAELAAAGPRAAAVICADSSDCWFASHSGSSRGIHHSTCHRCLFAWRPSNTGRFPQEVAAERIAIISRRGTRRISGRGSESAAAAAFAIVSSTRCLFAHSGAVESGSGVLCRTSSSETVSSPAQQSALGLYSANSISRTSYSSSHVCLEVVPEATEAHCGVSTPANITDVVSPTAVAGSEFVNTAGAVEAAAVANHSDSEAHNARRETGDGWFSRCYALDIPGDESEDLGAVNTGLHTLQQHSPTLSNDCSLTGKAGPDVGNESAEGCVSEYSYSIELQRSLSSVSNNNDPGRRTAENMALVHLEPRRRHRSLRGSADRLSARGSGSVLTAGSMNSVEEVAASEDTHQPGTLAQGLEACVRATNEANAPSHTQAEPTVQNFKSGSTSDGVSSAQIISDIHGVARSHPTQSPSDSAPPVAFTTTDTCAQVDLNGIQALVPPETGAGTSVGATPAAPGFLQRIPSRRTAMLTITGHGSARNSSGTRWSLVRQSFAAFVAPETGAGTSVRATPAAPRFLQRIPSRRTATLTITGRGSANNSRGTRWSLVRQSFASATSSAGRYNGLMFTSATDAAGHVATNRNAAMSLGPPVAVTERTSTTQRGILAAGGRSGKRSLALACMRRKTGERKGDSKQEGTSFRNALR